MKANEFRIGNYVSDIHASDSFYASVNKIHSDRIYYGNFHSNPTDIKPIPLTEEWLLKFGFIDGSKTIGNFYISVTLGENDIYINDGYGYEGAYIPLKCEHVHQLQNLYFDLTGEELNLSE